MKLELTSTAHGRVLESLDDTHVRVLKSCVLANKDDVNVVEEAVRAGAHVAPARHELLAVLLERRRNGDRAKVQTLLEEVDQALLAEEERDVVGGRHVVDTKDLLGRNVAEHRNLLHRGGLEGKLTTASKLGVSQSLRG